MFVMDAERFLLNRYEELKFHSYCFAFVPVIRLGYFCLKFVFVFFLEKQRTEMFVGCLE
jgi:hypothetical protein